MDQTCSSRGSKFDGKIDKVRIKYLERE